MGVKKKAIPESPTGKRRKETEGPGKRTRSHGTV